MAVLFTAAYAAGGDTFLSLLTDEPGVVKASGDYFYWALALPVAGVAAFIWDGVFIGCTLTRGMLVSMFVASAVFFISYYSLYDVYGNHALWFSFIAYLFIRGLVQTFFFKRL